MNGGLAQIYLKQALQLPGCPLCAYRRQAEDRYLQFLLWEGINDLEVRVKLSQSLGFCPQHGRRLLDLELEDWAIPLGNSTLYESLIEQVRSRVETAIQLVTGRMHRRQRGLAEWLLGRWMGRRDEPAHVLDTQSRCRACEIGEENAKHAAQVLAELLAQPHDQELYRHSSGLCLPHLRLTLRVARSEDGLQYLLHDTEERLRALRDDLAAFQDKQRSSQAAMTVTHEERAAAERAIAFLSGGDGVNRGPAQSSPVSDLGAARLADRR